MDGSESGLSLARFGGGNTTNQVLGIILGVERRNLVGRMIEYGRLVEFGVKGLRWS